MSPVLTLIVTTSPLIPSLARPFGSARTLTFYSFPGASGSGNGPGVAEGVNLAGFRPGSLSVSIRDRAGAAYAANVSARSSHDAARQAVAFFSDPFWRGPSWKGPKPGAETVLSVVPMGVRPVAVRVGSEPGLRTLGEQHGARLQTMDLRRGVRDEAALDQSTMAICLREIDRCKATGVRPDFIALLDDRYGRPSLPVTTLAALLVERRLIQLPTGLSSNRWCERDLSPGTAIMPQFAQSGDSMLPRTPISWGDRVLPGAAGSIPSFVRVADDPLGAGRNATVSPKR